MQLYERDFFISRVQAGYVPININNVRVLIYAPNKDLTLRANEIYIEEHNKAIDVGLLTEKELIEFLITQDLWSPKIEKEYQEILPTHIEEFKKNLYRSVLQSKTRDRIRKYLKAAKDEHARLHNIRSYYIYVTCEGYASYAKNMFLVSECARVDDNAVDWTDMDLNKVMSEYYGSLLSSDQLRELARTAPWSNMWNILKTNGKIFSNDDLTVEQQSLISWSLMYERIYESPDCPSDYVISDDDMLDGWLLIQKDEREANRKKAELEGAVGSKVSNADEIYVPVETFEDAKKIDLLNAPQVNRIKTQRMQQLQSKGNIKQQEFKDVQQKRAMQMQQAFNQQLKGRR
jgi:hypothetical protein